MGLQYVFRTIPEKKKNRKKNEKITRPKS